MRTLLLLVVLPITPIAAQAGSAAPIPTMIVPARREERLPLRTVGTTLPFDLAPVLGVREDSLKRTSRGVFYDDLMVGDGAEVRAGDSVAVHFVGKLKTAAQMVAILLLLYHGFLFGIDTDKVGTVLIYVAALLTLWSMGYYLRRAMPWILEKVEPPSP